jgi:selenocysteine lyase/cysteine desulfurase
VIGAVALHAAIDELGRIGWDAIIDHDTRLHRRLRSVLAAIPGVVVLGPDPTVPALPLATFTLTGTPHALVAARLSAEHGIGVRHGCFCAHPYLVRLLGLDSDQIARYWDAVRHHDRRHMPGAIRASAGLSTTDGDIDRLPAAVADIASGEPPPVAYRQDPHTGDFHVEDGVTRWPTGDRALGASCARG